MKCDRCLESMDSWEYIEGKRYCTKMLVKENCARKMRLATTRKEELSTILQPFVGRQTARN